MAYLKQNICAHRFAVGDDRFLVFSFAVPTIQFNTPANKETKDLVTDIHIKEFLQSVLRYIFFV